MVSNPSVRWIMFPYGMAKNPDGSWTFFNRDYKPLGVIADDWAAWDDPRHKLRIKGLGPATLKRLDVHRKGEGDRIYFYNDGNHPQASAAGMESYLEKLRILIGLKSDYSRR